MQQKQDRIENLEKNTDGNLIYRPHHDDLIYSYEELDDLIKQIHGEKIPEEANRSNVKRAHWIKSKLLNVLGYDTDKFRTKEAKKHAPRYIHQLIDIRTLCNSNLQIWGYDTDAELNVEWRSDSRYQFKDVRIVLVKYDIDTGVILSHDIVDAETAFNWGGNPETKTSKWQGTIPKSIYNKSDVYVGGEDPLTEELEINNSPFLNIEDIGSDVKSLIGNKISKDSTRAEGEQFQSMVYESLGYTNHKDDGTYPDIEEEYVEAKLQSSQTVDLNQYTPSDSTAEVGCIEDTTIHPKHVRYVIGLRSDIGDSYKINQVVVISGSELSDHIEVTADKNSKIQLQVPNFSEI